jgi:hypothetical protein
MAVFMVSNNILSNEDLAKKLTKNGNPIVERNDIRTISVILGVSLFSPPIFIIFVSLAKAVITYAKLRKKTDFEKAWHIKQRREIEYSPSPLAMNINPTDAAVEHAIIFLASVWNKDEIIMRIAVVPPDITIMFCKIGWSSNMKKHFAMNITPNPTIVAVCRKMETNILAFVESRSHDENGN